MFDRIFEGFTGVITGVIHKTIINKFLMEVHRNSAEESLDHCFLALVTTEKTARCKVLVSASFSHRWRSVLENVALDELMEKLQ